MTPGAIIRLFKEAYDTFPPLEGKPTDDNLLAIWRTLLPLFMVVPYNQLGGIHSLLAILTEATKYETDHGNKNSSVPNASLSAMIPLPMMPRQSSESVQRQPTNPSLLIMPVMRRPNVASPNSYTMLSTRSGTTISKTPTFFTQRSWP
jgi:hypothetical protein